MQKNIFASIFILAFTVIPPCGIYAQASKNCRACASARDSLIHVARDVAMTFGPAYVPFFKDVEISEAKIFQRDDYGDSRRKIRKQMGREYYEVVFTYDSTTVRFAFNYAAKVRIWKDTGTPLDVIFGNGMGRNFFFKSFKTQARLLTKKNGRTVTHASGQVPLQTENGPENIWEK